MTKNTYQVFEVIKEDLEGNTEYHTFYKYHEAYAFAQSLFPKNITTLKRHFKVRLITWLKLGHYRAQKQSVVFYRTDRLASKRWPIWFTEPEDPTYRNWKKSYPDSNWWKSHYENRHLIHQDPLFND